MRCTYYYNFCRIEPSSPGPSSDTNGTFTLEDDNVCLLKVHNGYHLYVNGKYVGSLDTIPDGIMAIPMGAGIYLRSI